MMSVAVCTSSAATAATFESILALPAAAAAASFSALWPAEKSIPADQEEDHHEYGNDNKADDADEAERPPGQFDIWSSLIQAQKVQHKDDEPYVHPLMRRSPSLLSQKSLETCTESLGSETGSDDFFPSDDDTDFFSLIPKKDVVEQQQQELAEADEEEDQLEYGERVRNGGRKELATVNYHCSISRRSSLPRSFPPPLPSISRRDGPCLQMRPHRRDGRLVVEAVAVPSQNYLHAERQNGRLLLSFINTCSSRKPTNIDSPVTARQTEDHNNDIDYEEAELQAEDIEEEEEEEETIEEEEEVEVVDRGTVVEVKVSTQPQQNSGSAALKVHRSSIVINKFVSCMPINNRMSDAITEAPPATAPSLSPVRRLSTATTTAAAAAVAASSLSALSAADGSHSSTTDNKLLFTSRRRSREELMHDMRRCSQLRKPLFIWEPCCIATSS